MTTDNKSRLLAKVGAGALALALPLVVYFEGEVRTSYRDPIGIITACVGHTGPELKMGQTYSAAQCQDMLYVDLAKHADDLTCITAPLGDPQRAAFLSFAFNVGRQKFCGSTLVRKANVGDLAGACNELPRWVNAGYPPKPLPGLVVRRRAERDLCMRGLS